MSGHLRYDPLPAGESGDEKTGAYRRRQYPLFWTLYFIFLHGVILLVVGLLLLLSTTSRGQKADSLLASELRE